MNRLIKAVYTLEAIYLSHIALKLMACRLWTFNAPVS